MHFTLLPRGKTQKKNRKAERAEGGITEERERGREGSEQDKQLMQSQSTLICVRPNHGILGFLTDTKNSKGPN